MEMSYARCNRVNAASLLFDERYIMEASQVVLGTASSRECLVLKLKAGMVIPSYAN